MSGQYCDDVGILSMCVERGCDFVAIRINGRRCEGFFPIVPPEQGSAYVCHAHRTTHRCIESDCRCVASMVDWRKARASGGTLRHEDTPCPIKASVGFEEPDQPEYRPGMDTLHTVSGDVMRPHWGAHHRQPHEGEIIEAILLACCPIVAAVFFTLATDDISDRHAAMKHGTASKPTLPGVHMNVTVSLVEAMGSALSSSHRYQVQCNKDAGDTVEEAMTAMLLGIYHVLLSPHQRLETFIAKYKASYTSRLTGSDPIHFHVTTVMLSLCLLRYLPATVFGEMFDNAILVNIFFDRVHSRHNTWSDLSTNIHLARSSIPSMVYALPQVVCACVEAHMDAALYVSL